MPPIASNENTPKIAMRERVERETLRTVQWKIALSKGPPKSTLIKSALCTLTETSQERDEQEYANGSIEREHAERTARRFAEELLERGHAERRAERGHPECGAREPAEERVDHEHAGRREREQEDES